MNDLFRHNAFYGLVEDVFQGLRLVLSQQVEIFGYIFTWNSLLQFSVMTIFFGACMIFLFGGEWHEK